MNKQATTVYYCCTNHGHGTTSLKLFLILNLMILPNSYHICFLNASLSLIFLVRLQFHVWDFLGNILTPIYYFLGNIESNEAKSLIQHIEEVLFTSLPPICKALLPSQYFANRIVKLGKGKNYYYPVEVLNQSDENSALLNYIQVNK